MKRISAFITLFSVALLVTLSNLPGTVVKSFERAVAVEPTSELPESAKRTAPLFENLGSHHHPISTPVPLAQRYFDQGLTLAYGFNHAEAARSFRAAAQLDPNCAMCYWGLAYVLGPNINAPMAEDAVPQSWEALQQALELSQHAPEGEQAYIQALAKRYSPTPVEDRGPFDLAYAKAMREVAQRYPDDLDAATLFAEALMDTTPWDYWEDNGDPKPGGAEIMATLESVLERNPNHPGANHLYIHAVEKERPELGIPAADRLRDLVPGAGHLVHMPSHIYIRVGRYHDAVVSNQRAVAADDAYVAQCRAQGLYPLVYMPHNHHFLWFAALLTGQSDVAMRAAQYTAQVDDNLMRQPEMAGTLQHFYTVPLYTLTRFGQWDEIQAAPKPAADLKYPTGVWHYARGLAFIRTGQLEQAAQELEQLQAIATAPELEDIKILGFNSTANILNIASEVLAGELAAEQGNDKQAIAHLEKAVSLEDALVYTEPADWSQPARQVLGAVLLQAGRAPKAEQVYRKDLEIYPENGWSLYGLAQSLSAQDKTEEAQAIDQRFQAAWQYADVTLSASRF